jgi:hypothetical protein
MRWGNRFWLAPVLGACVALAVLVGSADRGVAATKAGGELVVLDHERWLDTLKGTVKNFGQTPVRDVTIVVKFFDQKRKALGTQRVTVGDLGSGEQSSWSLAVLEPNRPATRYEFTVYAIRGAKK